ncbi:MAG: hypothetical protein ACRDYC_02530 [Acidimicrobiales bacterium]
MPDSGVGQLKTCRRSRRAPRAGLLAAGFTLLLGTLVAITPAAVAQTTPPPLPICIVDGPEQISLPGDGVSAGAALPNGSGFFQVTSDGMIALFGSAGCYGSPILVSHAPIVGMAVDAATGGYWLAAKDGTVFNYDAPNLGSLGGTHLNAPIVGIAADPASGGFWLAAADGGVFNFGAPFLGSLGGNHLSSPIVGLAADQATGGFWLAAANGGVFAFNAPNLGSLTGTHLNAPIVGIASPATGGYWLAAADGGVFSFGAPFRGSAVGLHFLGGVIAIVPASVSDGYWLVTFYGETLGFDVPAFPT